MEIDEIWGQTWFLYVIYTYIMKEAYEFDSFWL